MLKLRSVKICRIIGDFSKNTNWNEILSFLALQFPGIFFVKRRKIAYDRERGRVVNLFKLFFNI